MDGQHRIEPAPDGGVRFFLPPAERELLLQLRAELLSLLTSAAMNRYNARVALRGAP